MKKNRVKQLRTQLGLSQRKLAGLIGTSQQQIHRIETGTTPARLNLAKQLSKALGKPLETVFPGSGKVLKKVDEEFATGYFPTAETYSELNNLGIEGDPRIWFFKALLRGHEKPTIFEISSQDRSRLYRLVQDEGDEDSQVPFVIFDTRTERMALNLRELVYCHFLLEPLYMSTEPDNEDELSVQVFFCGNRVPFTFAVEPEYGDPDDEDDEGQFRNILGELETFTERHSRFMFEDLDGEDVFLRSGDIALMRVPLEVIHPTDLDEDEEDEQASSEGQISDPHDKA